MERIQYLKNELQHETLLTVRAKPFELKQAFNNEDFCRMCPNKFRKLTDHNPCLILKTMVENDGDTALIHLTCRVREYSSYSESSGPSSSPSGGGRLTMAEMVRARDLAKRW